MTLTLSGHTGNWHYKYTSPSGGQCSSSVSGTTAAVTGLQPSTTYTFKAYSDSCNTEIAAAAPFTTATPPPGGRDSSKDISVPDSLTDLMISIWSDGTTMFSTHYDSSALTKGIWAHNLSTKSRDTSKEFSLHADVRKPYGIGASTSTIYIADYYDSFIDAYNRSTKARDTNKKFDLLDGNDEPFGIWSDGKTLWVTNRKSVSTRGAIKLYAYRLSDGTRDAARDYDTLSAAGNGRPLGVWSNGVTMWVADGVDAKLYAYRASDKSRVPSKDYDLIADNDNPLGIWSDGQTMYVADPNDRKIYAYYAIDPGVHLSGHYVTSNTAMLYLSGHTGDWWYQHSAPTGGSCTSVSSSTPGATSVNLSDLTPETTYTFKAYSDSSCTNELAAAQAFTTIPLHEQWITNLTRTDGSDSAVTTTKKQAFDFTTGSASEGYLLTSFTGSLRRNGASGNLTVTLHTDDSSKPSATVKATLSGSNPSSSLTFADTTYACSGAGCVLSPSTKYYVVATYSSGSGEYAWRKIATAPAEHKHPANNGWDIGTAHTKDGANDWAAGTDTHFARLDFQPVPTLSVSDISATEATLALSRGIGQWYYKRVHPTGDDTCRSAGTGTTTKLSGLTGDATYNYTAYIDSGCTGALGTVYFSTSHSYAGNLTEPAATGYCAVGTHGGSNVWCATAFTTGNHSTGYTLKRVTARFDAKQGTPGDIVAAIHQPNGSNPASTALHTLSGSDPDTAGLYDFTCDGGCALSKDTTYFLVLTSPSSTGQDNKYGWTVTASDSQYISPAGSGWSIADAGRAWTGSNFIEMDSSATGVMHVAARNNPTLTASDITANTVKLTIGYHTGAWWYQHTVPAGGTCTSAGSAATVTVRGLAHSTAHTFKAYSDRDCSTELATAASFTTPTNSLTASSVRATGATMRLEGEHAAGGTEWHYQQTVPAGGECTSAGTNKTVSVSGLTPETDYTFKAYSNDDCSTELTNDASDADFTTSARSTPGIGTGAGTTKKPAKPLRDYFVDDNGSIFELDINKIAAAGITKGCNPARALYCPDRPVTRAQMASFLARALKLPTPPAANPFTDTARSYHRDAITAIAKAGITKGCNAAGTRYCPDRPVTRAQMAAFLARALKLGAPSIINTFTDTYDSHHRNAIEAIARAGITKGCNAAGTRYCPDRPVTRAQMAAFLARAFKL